MTDDTTARAVNHRTEAEDLIRVVKDHGTMADYAVAAVADAVLDLADAVRATAPRRKGPVLPLPRRAAPTDECQCGHRRMAHHGEDECRMVSCGCRGFETKTDG